MNEACRQMREWRARYPGYSTLLASVNLSARQFEHEDLVRDVARALEETGLDPGALGLEITERAAMKAAEETVGKFGDLKDLGVQLIIDDFGTGYSSLSYLGRFPVDFLKIDGAFVAGLGEGSRDEVIVSGITGLAHAMGIPLITEGVETAEQLARLRNLGCDQGQGNYFAEPLPSEKAGALLETNPRW